ncbi:MAG: gluconate 2-dehydrogenase subunit 3 family protein [Pseudomonadota bacterium]|nr:MAG: gluconate 2-dehydrogenase subunit 3 family protein [Pseudomonadota bacterium]
MSQPDDGHRKRGESGPTGCTRRELMRAGGLTAAWLAVVPAGALFACRHMPARRLEAEPWRTLGALYGHLLPDDGDGPGAEQAGTLTYARTVLPHTAVDRREFLLGRVSEFNQQARQQQGRPFEDLTSEQREALLLSLIEDSSWERWVSRHLDVVIESLLADPVYGGNIDGTGWRWLAHQPGFPAPPPDKRWYRLLDDAYFRPRRDVVGVCAAHG